jgi:hypothetical protein
VKWERLLSDFFNDRKEVRHGAYRLQRWLIGRTGEATRGSEQERGFNNRDRHLARIEVMNDTAIDSSGLFRSIW